MAAENTKPQTVDEYITRLPDEAKPIFLELREIVKKTAPGTEEVISYSIPALRQNGMIIFYAAWKEHTSLYPIPKGDAAFQKEIKPYVAGKGTLKFPFSKPLPVDLIKRIVQLRLAEHEEYVKAKKKKK